MSARSRKSFITRLRKGDCLRLRRPPARTRPHPRNDGLRAQPAKRASGVVPRWAGGKMPLSTEMADAALRELEGAVAGRFDAPEMRLARPLDRAAGALVGACRRRDALLVGVAAVARGPAPLPLSVRRPPRASRPGVTCWPGASAQATPSTFSIAINDYGFELLSPRRHRLDAVPGSGAPARCSARTSCWTTCWRSLNAGELALRRFREIARVAGLVFQGYPGRAEVDEAAAGVARPVLRGVPQVRRRQPPAAARPSARCSSRSSTSSGCAPRSSACAASASSTVCSRAPTPVRLSADGRAPARAADDRKAEGRGSSACWPNSRRRRNKAYKILCDWALQTNI